MRGRAGVNPAFFKARADGEKEGVPSLVARGHTDGQLNLSSRDLKEVPREVFDVSLATGAFWEIVPTSKLDLSFNQIKVLPPEIESLTDLVSLKIRHNQLSGQGFPPSFWGCTKLRHLDFAQNLIEDLEERIDGLVELRDLLIFENRLTRLPATLSALTQLQVLDVSSNQIDTFPEISLPGLVTLNVSKNRLVRLPVSLQAFAALENLDCGANRIIALPALTALSRLKRLEAVENKIALLPPLPSSLAFLNMGQNSLTELSSLEGLDSLSEIHVAGNSLTSIDAQLCRLPKLKVLDVGNNSLEDIPYTLGYIASLHRLVAVGNRIRSIRQALISNQTAHSTERLKEFLRTRGANPFDEGKDLPTTKGVIMGGFGGVGGVRRGGTMSTVDYRIREACAMSLDLSELELCSLRDCDLLVKLFAAPHVLDPLTQTVGIVELNLTGNFLQEIPQELSALKMLKSLNLSRNKLGMGNCKSATDHLPLGLLSLFVSKNGLTTQNLSCIIAGARNLQVLIASSNAIDSIPQNLQSLSELRELSLSFNRVGGAISDIDFSRLAKLETLDLSSNKIADISCLEAATSALQTLLLDNNDLVAIPSFLGSTRFNFKSLSFHGNPQKTVRMAVLQKGTTAIVDLLRLRCSAGES